MIQSRTSAYKSRKKSALRAARRGWPVFPLHSLNDDGKCTCGKKNCSSPGKHPLTPHGVKDATTDKKIIRKWWQEQPNANVGIATGRRSGLVVLDIDFRNDGFTSLKKFEAEYGALPDGPQIITGGGGRHIYFLHPGGEVKNKIGILPGIDVRGDGGYVVGPGSLHESEKHYLWATDKTPKKVPLPPLPERVFRLIEGKPSARQSVALIPDGQRNSTLTSLAGSMRVRGMTREAIEAALLEENRLRCDPPLTDSEVIGVARSIAGYAPGDAGILSASSKDNVAAERITLKFLTGKQIAIETPTATPWIVPPLVASGAITEVDGKVKLAGKTTFLMHMSSAVLDGSPFLGEATTKSEIVYLTEQHIVSFRAAMERAGLLGRKNFTVLSWPDTIGTSWRSVAESAVEECRRKGAKLLVIDTLAQFAQLVGDTENNAGDALKALQPLQKAAAEGIAIVIVRHERKKGGALGESGRGSSAFAGAVDIIISLRRPAGKQPRNVRLLQAVSRFDSPDDLLIELVDEGYRVLGTPGEAARKEASANILSAIPKSDQKAATIERLITITGKARAHVQKHLEGLLKTGQISRSGEGRKNSPFRYHKD
jgi:Bifunctional DNA primase/polymerase, N-terminal/AAA domain/Primase C terminal 1 (PriCT-1)